MSDDPYRRVFPLYVSAFERFMQADDRLDYPMCFVISMEFTGQLRRDVFETAIRKALDRHRLLQSLLEPAKKGRLCWVHYPDLFPYLDWAEEGIPIDSPQGDHIDLQKEIGLRLWVRQGPERVEITFYFHHSCVDGIAAHRFMGDVFAIYTNECCEDKPARLVEIHPEFLKTRGRRQQLAGQSGDHPHTAMYAWKYLFRVSMLGTDPLRTPRKKSSTELLTPRFGVMANRLSVDEYRQLRDASVNLGVTVNDILVAQTFQTLFAWNSKIHKKGRKREARILMPVDLRNRGDDQMPCSNMTSYNYLTRHPRDLTNLKTFLQGIRSETLAIKNKGMGSAFIDAITRATFIPWTMKLALSRYRCMSTCVLTNVGDPTRRWTATLPREKGQVVCGDLLLEDMSGCPPLRPKTRVSVAITTYMRRLTVGIRCDPHYFDTQNTQEILDHYMKGLLEWIELARQPADQTRSLTTAS